MVKHVFIRCVARAWLLGGRALVLHALGDQAAAFWRRRGVQLSKDEPLTLVQLARGHRRVPPIRRRRRLLNRCSIPALGDEFVDSYAKLKLRQWNAYSAAISP
jgi:hypothetical protein